MLYCHPSGRHVSRECWGAIKFARYDRQRYEAYVLCSLPSIDWNTERPVTVSMGTNVLVGQDSKKLSSELTRILEGEGKTGSIPPLWDGQTGERIAKIICKS